MKKSFVDIYIDKKYGNAEECPNCFGSGIVQYEDECPSCEGNGFTIKNAEED